MDVCAFWMESVQVRNRQPEERDGSMEDKEGNDVSGLIEMRTRARPGECGCISAMD